MNSTHALVAPRRALAIIMTFLALVAGSGAARAQSALVSPPEKMSYQGFLVDSTGTALGNASPVNYVVTFRIYTTATGPTTAAIWGEQQAVTVDKGNFSVVLGDGVPTATSDPRPALSTVFTGQYGGPTFNVTDRYIGVSPTINGVTAELLPRLRLMPAPYSFMASRANAITRPNGTNVLSYDPSINSITISAPVVANSFVGSGVSLSNFTASQIPTLDASKVTTGVFSDARIPTPLTGIRGFTGGRVGVGTASPSWNFHIFSPDWYAALIESSSTIGTWLGLVNSTANGRYWGIVSTGSGNSEGAGKLLFNDQTGGGNRLVLDSASGGFVGINTASPAATLDVQAKAGTQGTATFLPNPSQGGNRSHVHYGGNGDWYIRSANSSGTVNIQDTGGYVNLYGSTYISSLNANFTSLSANNSVFSMQGGNSRMAINAPEYCDVSLSINARGSGACGTIAIYSSSGSMWKAGGGSWTAASDSRLKSVVGQFTSSLDQLAAVNVVRYKYLAGNPLNLDTENEYTGFVAQDLQKIMPAAVSEGKDGYLGVNLDHVYLAGINAIKELAVQSKAKDAKILALEKELAAVKNASTQYEARLAAIEKALAQKSAPVQ